MPGKLIVRKYYESTVAATDSIVWSPAKDRKWKITDVIISSEAAGKVTLEDKLSTGDVSCIGATFAANGGLVSNFQTPMQSDEFNADLTVTTTVTTGLVRIMLTGEEIL